MSEEADIKALSAPELAQWLDEVAGGRPAPALLDVREEWEVEHCALAGVIHVALGELPLALGRLEPHTPVVCICHHGIRSMRAALYLHSQGFSEVYNLTGGVDAWARTVDSNMPRY